MKRTGALLLLSAALLLFGCSSEQNLTGADEELALVDLEPADVEKLVAEEAGIANAEALQIVKRVNNIIEVQYETFTTVVESNVAIIEEQDSSTVAVRRAGDILVSVRFDGDDVLWSTAIQGIEVMTVRRLANNDLEINIADPAGQLQAKVQDNELHIAFKDNAGNVFTVVEKNGGNVTVTQNNVVIEGS